MQREYTEDKFLEKAMRLHAFRCFYDEYRQVIRWPVHWIVNPDVLPPRVHGCTDHHLGECAVVLPHYPAKPSAIHVLAHEMSHLVLDSQGFPATGWMLDPESTDAILSPLLTSSLHDPLIEGRLAACGFDVVAKYERWSKDALSDMRQAQARFREDLPFSLRTQRTLLAVKHRLWWAAIQPERRDPFFWEVVVQEFPELSDEASALSGAIEDNGYSAPDCMADALEMLRGALGLESMVSTPEPMS